MQSLMSPCSFAAMLHPEYDAIKAQSDLWILCCCSSQTVVDNLPHLASLAYAQCPAKRVVQLSKYLAWIFCSDDDDDDPCKRGACDADVLSRRHCLILSCYAGHKLLLSDVEVEYGVAADDPVIAAPTRGLPALHNVWAEIAKDMTPRVLARFHESMKDHLNGNRIQAHYRASGRYPGVEEYVVAVRRPASAVLSFLILLEYGLGIELDDNTLHNETLQRLLDAVSDHVALNNDLFSYGVELACNDHLNLPCIIFHEETAARASRSSSHAATQRQGEYTFSDAMQRARQMVKEVDQTCVQLLAEIEDDDRMMHSQGVPAFLQGLRLWMAGNVEWSLHTARYKLSRALGTDITSLS